MKKMLVLGLLLIASTMNAKDKVYLSNCTNFVTGDDAVSFSYESCVNRNFDTISYALEGLYLSNCYNFDRKKVSYSFTSCINQNFSTISSKLSNSPYLRSCFNFKDDQLGYSFVSCVNQNYSTVGREL